MFIEKKIRTQIEALLGRPDGIMTAELFEKALTEPPLAKYYDKQLRKTNSKVKARHACFRKFYEQCWALNLDREFSFIELGYQIVSNNPEYDGPETSFYTLEVLRSCYEHSTLGKISDKDQYDLIDMDIFKLYPDQEKIEERRAYWIRMELRRYGFMTDYSRDRGYDDPESDRRSELKREFGDLKQNVVCPHCQTKGQVYAQKGQEITRSRDADLVGAVIGKKQVTTKEVTVLSCTNCEMQWNA